MEQRKCNVPSNFSLRRASAERKTISRYLKTRGSYSLLNNIRLEERKVYGDEEKKKSSTNVGPWEAGIYSDHGQLLT